MRRGAQGTLLVAVAATIHLTAWAQSKAWSELGPLPRSDAAVQDGFGNQIAISGDTAIVGSNSKTVGSNAFQGAAYVFVRNGATFVQQGPALTLADGKAYDSFGLAVAISGDTALVGSIAKNGVAVFVRNGTTWTQQGPLLAPSDVATGDYFGAALAISGDTALIGAYGKTVGTATKQGAAYVFVRTGTTWAQQGPPLPQPDGVGNDGFGSAVALAGDTALVGAYEKTVGTKQSQGEAYVYVRSGTTWTEQGPPLTGSDSIGSDFFSSAVALSGDTVLIGAGQKTLGTQINQGETYVFVRAGTTWTQQGPPLTALGGASSDNFGSALSLSGDTAAIGAYDKTVGANSYQGGAYVFTRTGTSWTQQGPVLTSKDGTSADYFGGALALSGSTLLIGASGMTVGSNEKQGTAYVFNAPCTSSADCPTGASCTADGACKSDASSDAGTSSDASPGTTTGAVCSGDLKTSLPKAAGSDPIVCSPYACDAATGGCRARCTSQADCASGGTCGPNNQCTVGTSSANAPSASDASSSCGCRVAPDSLGGQRSLAAVLLLGLASCRRRKRGATNKRQSERYSVPSASRKNKAGQSTSP